jgi:flavin-dependent dehydrogenase
MAIAIHSAKILTESIMRFAKKGAVLNRTALENDYRIKWEKEFQMRLNSGRMIQKLFGNTIISDLTVSTLAKFPSITQMLVKKTHGEKLKY